MNVFVIPQNGLFCTPPLSFYSSLSLYFIYILNCQFSSIPALSSTDFCVSQCPVDPPKLYPPLVFLHWVFCKFLPVILPQLYPIGWMFVPSLGTSPVYKWKHSSCLGLHLCPSFELNLLCVSVNKINPWNGKQSPIHYLYLNPPSDHWGHSGAWGKSVAAPTAHGPSTIPGVRTTTPRGKRQLRNLKKLQNIPSVFKSCHKFSFLLKQKKRVL